jgi:hypothetical protein
MYIYPEEKEKGERNGGVKKRIFLYIYMYVNKRKYIKKKKNFFFLKKKKKNT